jgi:hypothetical protein
LKKLPPPVMRPGPKSHAYARAATTIAVAPSIAPTIKPSRLERLRSFIRVSYLPA